MIASAGSTPSAAGPTGRRPEETLSTGSSSSKKSASGRKVRGGKRQCRGATVRAGSQRNANSDDAWQQPPAPDLEAAASSDDSAPPSSPWLDCEAAEASPRKPQRENCRVTILLAVLMFAVANAIDLLVRLVPKPKRTSACFHLDSAWMPLDTAGGPLLRTSNASSCQLRCSLVPACEQFTFLSDHRCYLQARSAHQSFLAGAVSGLAHCEASLPTNSEHGSSKNLTSASA